MQLVTTLVRVVRVNQIIALYSHFALITKVTELSTNFNHTLQLFKS